MEKDPLCLLFYKLPLPLVRNKACVMEWDNWIDGLIDPTDEEARSLIVIIEGLVKKKFQRCSVQNADQILKRHQHFSCVPFPKRSERIMATREVHFYTQKHANNININHLKNAFDTSIAAKSWQRPSIHLILCTFVYLKSKVSFRYLMSHGQGHPESRRDEDKNSLRRPSYLSRPR